METDYELFQLCNKVYKAKLWPYESMGHHDRHFWHRLADNDYKDVKVIRYGQITTRDGASICPLYDANFLLTKVRDYDFTIVNLNHKDLSLTSDSLNDPEAAIFGGDFTKVLLEFLLVLKEQGIIYESH